MGHYYLDDDSQRDGAYEVHEDECLYISDSLNRTYLGCYSGMQEAIVKAQLLFPLKKIKGCVHCLHSVSAIQDDSMLLI
ncbi:hypothetical protein D0T84_14285 [Dysgonomonas sp. 521]|uniref:hypothetical protein n=1 Tax=Dysgonomonas sp. 521 TaxID=2302932 RepID=UPI0013D24703|nr:hypothetical protein [Dysgonomonas sp. 521]NDV96072.1 hypothetical protein [Dysgonomonas sp. 521]